MSNNKELLIEIYAEKAGVSKTEAKDRVNLFVESLKEAIVKDPDSELGIPGFGEFQIVEKPARTMNKLFGIVQIPPLQIPPRKVVRFSPWKGLEDALKTEEDDNSVVIGVDVDGI